jgi:hypothetical protein
VSFLAKSVVALILYLASIGNNDVLFRLLASKPALFSPRDCGYGPYCQRNATFLPELGLFIETCWLHSRNSSERASRSIVVEVHINCVRLFEGTTTMAFKTLATAACIALSSATASYAAPINLDFTVGGVSATFYGLDDAIFTTQKATSFDLFAPIANWTDVDSSTFVANSFVFSLSGLKSFEFFSGFPVAITDVSGGVKLTVVDLLSDPFESYFRYSVAVDGGRGGSADLAISLENFTIDPISPVPLPAGGLLLLSGLAGVVALKRRKKRTA